MMANMYHMDKRLIEQREALSEIITKADVLKLEHEAIGKAVDNLKYVLDVQRVLDKNLFPAFGFERLKAELIQSLVQKSDEFAMYDKMPIEHISGYANGKTVAVAHYSWLISEYAITNNLTEIEAVGIEPARLTDVCREKDTLIISNPALSALILLNPDLLSEIAQKLRQNLTLIIRAAPNPVRVLWEGFYDTEREIDEKLFRWRWAEGNKDNCICLINLKTTQVTAELNWLAESLCGTGELAANCCGETVKAELNSCKDFKLSVTLNPGYNELTFSFSGPSKSPGTGDKRNLAFRIIDFSCRVDGINVAADFIHEDKVLSVAAGSIHEDKLLLADDFILRTLHNSGFYDVTSTAYANHGISKRGLKKTRYTYPYPYNYRIVSSSEDTIERDDIVCYNACRLTQEVYDK
jgi:hypothetical protein